MEFGIIYKSDKRKYHYKGISSKVVNDQSEELPFEKPSDDNVEIF